MFAPPFEAFVAPARARPALWRLILGTALALGIYVLVVIAILGAYAGLSGRGFDGIEGILDPSDPVSLLYLLATFVGMALGPMIVARVLHKRSYRSLFGPAARVLRDFVLAAGIAGTILAVSLVGWSFIYDAVPNLAFDRWLALLPLALVGILIQTGAEELLFRGYLQQQLAARFASPLAWLFAPALLFGLVHFDPTSAGDSAWIVVGAAAFFGLVAGDLTARTGSIGAAWGFHFINNCMALLVVATEGSLSGLGLWRTPYSVDQTSEIGWLILIDLLVLALIWAAIRRLLAR